MKSRWENLVTNRSWESECASRCWEELEKRYEGAARFYHSFFHIEDCLNQLGELKLEASSAIELAIWFHDVIYEIDRSDNEAISGDFAVAWLEQLGESAGMCEAVDRLINATDHRSASEAMDEQIIVDIDLSILGSEPARYHRYCQQIRAEYSEIPDEVYRDGRARVLRSFLQRPVIYRSEFYQGLEEPARENLVAELSGLET
ncbi:MAG: hypothetical protein P1U89_15720 [Verrucomicrobiales bacterium]|nr:hypothetical protein [Verrucomicrobiales bacterium]